MKRTKLLVSDIINNSLHIGLPVMPFLSDYMSDFFFHTSKWNLVFHLLQLVGHTVHHFKLNCGCIFYLNKYISIRISIVLLMYFLSLPYTEILKISWKFAVYIFYGKILVERQ